MREREGRLMDGRLFYRAWLPDGPRATVIVSHGFAEHSGRYHHVGKALSNAGFSTWAVDHEGHGQSEGDRGSVSSIPSAEAGLDALVDLALADGSPRPVFLVGHSLGGLIAVAYAEEHQDRLTGLVISGAAIMASPALEALAEMEEIPAMPIAPLVSRDPAVVKAYEDDPLNYLGPIPRAMFDVFGRDRQQVQDRLSEITLPILVMHGGADALVPPESSEIIHAGVSSTDKTLTIWPDLYHEIFNEPEQDEVIKTAVQWIEARL